MNENSPEWMTASECETKCIKLIRSIYFEILSIMSTHGEDQRFTENIPEIHARSLNDQVSNEDTKSDEKDDWLSPFIATNTKFNSTNKCFSKEHAMEIKNECLKAMKERLDERKTSLQVQIHKEHKRLSSLLHGDVHDILRCKILEKRLQSHEELVPKRLQVSQFILILYLINSQILHSYLLSYRNWNIRLRLTLDLNSWCKEVLSVTTDTDEIYRSSNIFIQFTFNFGYHAICNLEA